LAGHFSQAAVELAVIRRLTDLLARTQTRDGWVRIGYKIKILENDAQKSFGEKLIPLNDS